MNLTNSFEWKELFALAKNKEDIENIKELKETIVINEVEFLFKIISEFKNPGEIKVIEEYQDKQHKLGAWVPGIFPDQFLNENLTIPDTFSNKVKFILELARQQEKNIKAITDMNEYNLYFENNDLDLSDDYKAYPDDWNLKIDLKVLAETLEFLKLDKVNKDKAKKIANLDGNQEMLKHRKNLGYLPEPITDTDDLAELLVWAASNRPEDIIWKWLNPLNIFELADIYNNLSAFENLFKEIESNSEILCNKILAEIHKYINFDLNFNETFSLTIGFAIRGWATDNKFGVNIENIKDNYKKLIATIGHELFHRLQTIICATNNQPQKFSEIVSGDFTDERDNKFYTVLSYIMLEGTGEFITDHFLEFGQAGLEEDAIKGFELLEKIFEVIYIKGDLEKADKLLAKGLKSNGIFYSLGKYLTKLLVTSKGEDYLGRILKKGVASFFVEGLEVTDNMKNNKLILKIKNLKT